MPTTQIASPAQPVTAEPEPITMPLPILPPPASGWTGARSDRLGGTVVRRSGAGGAAGFDYDVAIVGLGYVGLPTALAYRYAGGRVLGLDSSAHRLRAIRAGDVDLVSGDRARLSGALQNPAFELSADPRALQRAAAVVICVPTPIDEHAVPDLEPLRAACRSVVDRAVAGQVIVLTSTTYVGCTEDLLVEPLTEAGFVIGRDVFVAFCAERIDPGSEAVAQEAVPRVLGAATPQCEEEAFSVLHRYVRSIHRVSSLAAAEMTKLLENTFRAVNIALANEFADICRRLDVPVTDVIGAAATKPYGFMPFTPGPGVGGHCIPCDPHYLLWQLRADRIEAPLISRAMAEIADRPGRVVDRIREQLGQRGIALPRARVLVVGVAYKPDVADLRESPAIDILHDLRAAGAEIGFVDVFVAEVRMRDGSTLLALDDPAAFDPDLVLLHTAHRGTRVDWIGTDRLVLDATYRSTLPQRVLL